MPQHRKQNPGHWLNRQSVTRLFYSSCCLLALAAGLLAAALYSESHTSRVVVAHAVLGFPIGTTLSQGVTTVKLESVRYEEGQGVFQAPAGKRYAVVTISITNRSDKPINVLPTTDSYVKDSHGNTIYLTPFTLQAPLHAGELPPGETVRGELSYLTPDTGSLRLYIDAIWSGGVLKYELR